MYPKINDYVSGGSLTDFQWKGEISYQSAWSSAISGNLADPKDWLKFAMDWGVGILLFPFITIYAITSRKDKIAIILLAGLPFIILPFVAVNRGAVADMYRFAVMPL